MPSQAGIENHIVLCNDGTVFDLLDTAISLDTIENTITSITNAHGDIVTAVSTPYKLFAAEVIGLKKTGEFVKIGKTNWPNLFMIRGEFQYFLSYAVINKEKKLIAHSQDGLSWQYDIIDA